LTTGEYHASVVSDGESLRKHATGTNLIDLCTHAQVAPSRVDTHDCVPVVSRAFVCCSSCAFDTGTVDRTVKPTKRVHHKRYGALDSRFVRHVNSARDTLAARSLHRRSACCLSRSVSSSRSVQVGHDHARASRGQPNCDGSPDSTSATSDEHRSSRQSRHRLSLHVQQGSSVNSGSAVDQLCASVSVTLWLWLTISD
jgi:hypothetical protein